MKWTVLVDNRTNDPVLETEHGLSIFLETGVLWLSPTGGVPADGTRQAALPPSSAPMTLSSSTTTAATTLHR